VTMPVEVNIGAVFGRYTVVGNTRSGDGHQKLLVSCSCGSSPRPVRAYYLRNGLRQSCGCLSRERQTIHGASKTPEYHAWTAAVRRTQNPSNAEYPNYGGRGIKMAPEFVADFHAFLSEVGLRPARGYSIDRIDNNRGYEPGNIRWATMTEQSRNRRSTKLTAATAQNIRETQGCAAEIARNYGVSSGTVLDIRKGRKWKDAAVEAARQVAK
jgi:hypothetical protein